MTLLKGSSASFLLRATIFFLSYSLYVDGAEWKPSYLKPLHSHLVAEAAPGVALREPDAIHPQRRKHAFELQNQSPVAEWDPPVWLNAQADPLPGTLRQASQQDYEVRGEASSEDLVTPLGAGAATSSRQRRRLLLRNVALLLGLVMAMYLGFSSHYNNRIKELQNLAQEQARVIAAREQQDIADGHTAVHHNEDVLRGMGLEDLFLAAQQRGHHLIADADLVALIEKASAAEHLERQEPRTAEHSGSWITQQPSAPPAATSDQGAFVQSPGVAGIYPRLPYHNGQSEQFHSRPPPFAQPNAGSPDGAFSAYNPTYAPPHDIGYRPTSAHPPPGGL